FAVPAPDRHVPPFPPRRSSDLSGENGTGYPDPHVAPYPFASQVAVRPAARSYSTPAVAVTPVHDLRRIRPRIALQIATVEQQRADRKSTRLNSSHVSISYAVFC